MILEGKKVILRYPKLSDAKWLFENVKKQEVARNLGYIVTKLKSVKDEIKFIKKQPIQRKKKIALSFVIIDKKTKNLVGMCNFHNFDQHSKRTTAGWWIAKEYWGKNYSIDALRLLINFGFKKLKLHRIEAEVYKSNPRSLNFAKKIGFKVEGISREKWLKQGKFLDTYSISLLKKEWKG